MLVNFFDPMNFGPEFVAHRPPLWSRPAKVLQMLRGERCRGFEEQWFCGTGNKGIRSHNRPISRRFSNRSTVCSFAILPRVGSEGDHVVARPHVHMRFERRDSIRTMIQSKSTRTRRRGGFSRESQLWAWLKLNRVDEDDDEDRIVYVRLSLEFLQAFGGDDELRRTPSGARPLSSSEQKASSLSGRVASAREAMESSGRSIWGPLETVMRTIARCGTSTARRDGGGEDGGGPGEDTDG